MFKNKNILICGMARSGQAAAVLLSELGARVTVQDMKNEIEFDYAKYGMSAYLGKNPDQIICDFDIVVISPGISVYEGFLERAIVFGIPVWGEAELAYRLCPCSMVAITGTNGKTTVTTLVGEILKLHNPKTVVAGNIGVPLTGLVSELSSENIVVAEISSFQLETIAAFRPSISAVLNMTPDHLDRHRNMENYIAMKARIFENQRQDDITVLNYDNDITRKMSPPGKVLYFSTQSLPKGIRGVYCEDGYICSNLGGKAVKIIETANLKVMLENALAATLLSLAADVPVSCITQGLTNFKGVEHRLQHIAKINGVDYYNDSKATNTDAAVKALESFSEPVVLIAGGSDKKSDFMPWVQLFDEKVASLVLIGETTMQIIDTCDRVGYKNYHRASTLEDAVILASKLAKKTVVFSPACASFDMFKNFEHRGNLFVEYVNKLK